MVRQKKSSNRDKSSGPKSVSRSGKSSPAGSSAQTELALGSASACCGCALFSSGGGGGGVADVEEFAAKVVCTICRFFSISGGCRCRRGSAHDLFTPAARPWTPPRWRTCRSIPGSCVCGSGTPPPTDQAAVRTRRGTASWGPNRRRRQRRRAPGSSR
jgi:hypothetical protein